MTDPIVKTIDVPCSPAHAFNVFANRIADWWPLDGHAASAAAGKAALGVTVEPRVGGRVFETMHDGAIDLWGEVLTYVPGEGLSFTWHPGNNKAHPTHVSVSFAAVANGACRVTLTHSGWEAWADRAADMRENYNKGWDFVFGQRFASAAEA
ncbi:MAG: SRPBCC domain-containing protein [Paracoccaceae bacterium]